MGREDFHGVCPSNTRRQVIIDFLSSVCHTVNGPQDMEWSSCDY